jgi:cation transport ATPase
VPRDLARRAPAALVLPGLGTGGLLWAFDEPAAARAAWAVAVAVTLPALAWSVGRALAARRIGVDVIALLAMVGSLALGEYLAGAVIALMVTGGEALEAAAGRRARRELTALVDRAPRHAHRLRGGAIEEVPVAALAPGDEVLVRTGDVLPVDGAVAGDEAIVDESALTGESLPVALPRGAAARSGTVNAGPPFTLRATRPASESGYAALVRLVQEAEARRAPLIRMADRYAALFLPLTLVLAGAAWAATGDPVRALAVLVVATPCPLILAVPVALISGVSRAARHGVVVKGAAAIEALGHARTVLIDKTGTLTEGAPHIERVIALDGLEEQEVARLAASLEQLSPHVLAEAMVHDERARGMPLVRPTDVLERPGQGIEGRWTGVGWRWGASSGSGTAATTGPRGARAARPRSPAPRTSSSASTAGSRA